MAISLGSGFFTIRAKDEATGAVRGMGDDMKRSLADVANMAVNSMALAGGAVLGFLGASVKAFADSEAAQAQLGAALKSTGGAAGMTADELNKYAAAVQKNTAFEDDAVTATQALLLTFTNIHKDVFPKAMDAILDMSVAMHQDLQGSAIQVGKALNDPIKGITALTRVGVTFTEEQKNMIESLVLTGHTADAQRMIIAELAKEFGGSASAQAETFTGKLAQLKNQMGDLMENIGQALIPALQQLAKEFTPVLQGVAQWVQSNPEATASSVKWAGAIAAIGLALVPLRAIVLAVAAAFPLISGAIGAIAAAVGLPVAAVVAAIALIGVAAYEVIAHWDTVKEFFSNLWENITALTSAAGERLGEIAGWIAQNVVQYFTDPIGFITEAWGGLTSFFQSIWDGVKSVFEWAVANILDPVIDKVSQLWSALTGSFSQGFSEGYSGGSTPGMAEGGRVGRSGPVLVGERGPELLFLPTGAEVLPARDTAGLLGGGGGANVSINFGGVVVREEADMDTLVGKMTRALERTLSQRGLRMA